MYIYLIETTASNIESISEEFGATIVEFKQPVMTAEGDMVSTYICKNEADALDAKDPLDYYISHKSDSGVYLG